MQETETGASPASGAQENVEWHEYGKHVIAITERGWIFIGYIARSLTGKRRLDKVQNVRCWSNGLGIGGLTRDKHKGDYKLDKMGDLEFAQNTYVRLLDVEW